MAQRFKPMIFSKAGSNVPLNGKFQCTTTELCIPAMAPSMKDEGWIKVSRTNLTRSSMHDPYTIAQHTTIILILSLNLQLCLEPTSFLSIGLQCKFHHVDKKWKRKILIGSRIVALFLFNVTECMHDAIRILPHPFTE